MLTGAFGMAAPLVSKIVPPMAPWVADCAFARLASPRQTARKRAQALRVRYKRCIGMPPLNKMDGLRRLAAQLPRRLALTSTVPGTCICFLDRGYARKGIKPGSSSEIDSVIQVPKRE